MMQAKRCFNVRSLSLLLLTTVLITSAHTAEAQTATGQTVEARKSPGTAFILSLLVMGTGQAYNDQLVKGGLMFGGGVASATAVLTSAYDCDDDSDDCGLYNAGLVGFFGFWLWSILDAPYNAYAINRRIDAGQVALEIGPQLIAPNADSRVGLSLVRVRF